MGTLEALRSWDAAWLDVDEDRCVVEVQNVEGLGRVAGVRLAFQ